MEMIVIFSIIIVFFVLIDLVGIRRKEQPKLFWLYVISLCTAYIISIALALDISMPSPATYIANIVKSLISQH